MFIEEIKRRTIAANPTTQGFDWFKSDSDNGFDSLDWIEFTMATEEVLDIEFNESDELLLRDAPLISVIRMGFSKFNKAQNLR